MPYPKKIPYHIILPIAGFGVSVGLVVAVLAYRQWGHADTCKDHPAPQITLKSHQRPPGKHLDTLWRVFSYYALTHDPLDPGNLFLDPLIQLLKDMNMMNFDEDTLVARFPLNKVGFSEFLDILHDLDARYEESRLLFSLPPWSPSLVHEPDTMLLFAAFEEGWKALFKGLCPTTKGSEGGLHYSEFMTLATTLGFQSPEVALTPFDIGSAFLLSLHNPSTSEDRLRCATHHELCGALLRCALTTKLTRSLHTNEHKLKGLFWFIARHLNSTPALLHRHAVSGPFIAAYLRMRERDERESERVGGGGSGRKERVGGAWKGAGVQA